MFIGRLIWKGFIYALVMIVSKFACGLWLIRFKKDEKNNFSIQNLYPTSMLGLAMVARGEIGFLISSLAEAKGVFSPNSEPKEGHHLIFILLSHGLLFFVHFSVQFA